jgi:hypothetical protein
MTKRNRIADAIDALTLIYALIRPGNPTADLIESIGKGFADTISIAMTGRAKVELHKRCLKHIVWPNTVGGWVIWNCPSVKGHTHPHSDENYFSIYRDDDIAFMWDQYRLLNP